MTDSGERVVSLLAEADALIRVRRYQAAAERARLEDWPDDAWKHWRYRRASLARVLAQEGMMPEVAHAYGATLHVPVGRDL